MTRDKILAAYDVQNGIIRSPGKYEAEPIYAPYFHNEMADETLMWPDDDGTTDIHMLDAAEDRMWPELAGAAAVVIEVSEQGFVSCTPHTEAELNTLLADNEHEWEMHEETEEGE